MVLHSILRGARSLHKCRQSHFCVFVLDVSVFLKRLWESWGQFLSPRQYQAHTNCSMNVPTEWTDMQMYKWMDGWMDGWRREGDEGVRKLSSLLRWTSSFFLSNWRYMDNICTKKWIQEHVLQQVTKWLHKILLQSEPDCIATKRTVQMPANREGALRYNVKWQEQDPDQYVRYIRYVRYTTIFLMELGGRRASALGSALTISTKTPKQLPRVMPLREGQREAKGRGKRKTFHCNALHLIHVCHLHELLPFWKRSVTTLKFQIKRKSTVSMMGQKHASDCSWESVGTGYFGDGGSGLGLDRNRGHPGICLCQSPVSIQLRLVRFTVHKCYLGRRKKL